MFGIYKVNAGPGLSNLRNMINIRTLIRTDSGNPNYQINKEVLPGLTVIDM